MKGKNLQLLKQCQICLQHVLYLDKSSCWKCPSEKHVILSICEVCNALQFYFIHNRLGIDLSVSNAVCLTCFNLAVSHENNTEK